VIDNQRPGLYFRAFNMGRIMCGKDKYDELAARIKQEIEKLGSCDLHNRDLAVLWGDAGPIPTAEYQMRLANFSIQYGFLHRADAGLDTVCFRKLGQGI
jgi:hypothetical protein